MDQGRGDGADHGEIPSGEARPFWEGDTVRQGGCACLLEGGESHSASLCLYFFVLLAESLPERELQRAMARKGIESAPLYSEERACRQPRARRVTDLFEDIQRHTPSIVASPHIQKLVKRQTIGS